MNQTVLRFEDRSSIAPAKRTDETISIIGLGYVGLPLATALAEKYASVIGYDISEARVEALQKGLDHNDEVPSERLITSGLRSTSVSGDLRGQTVFVVTVPTPLTEFRQPDLEPLEAACATVARHIRPGGLVIFESTVYPGVTEEVCVPLLEEFSGLQHLRDFNVAYSPERMNPGDHMNTVETTAKLISADTNAACDRVRQIYSTIVGSELYHCPSIRVAEAAKALENTQRDVNIALMNEMSSIFDKLGISTRDVLDAAATKWNFLPFQPGLVGGHCIGVDPHYLSAAAERAGARPSLIRMARDINDGVAARIADRVLRYIATLGRPPNIALLGITFKENVPDIRNSQALTLLETLQDTGLRPLAVDPIAEHACLGCGVAVTDPSDLKDIDVLILAVPHTQLLKVAPWTTCLSKSALVIDVKSAIPKNSLPAGTLRWTL
ncbi:MAG: nucleotide sugar dehydrogenase [Pseudomonadota bacterium]